MKNEQPTRIFKGNKNYTNKLFAKTRRRPASSSHVGDKQSKKAATGKTTPQAELRKALSEQRGIARQIQAEERKLARRKEKMEVQAVWYSIRKARELGEDARSWKSFCNRSIWDKVGHAPNRNKPSRSFFFVCVLAFQAMKYPDPVNKAEKYETKLKPSLDKICNLATLRAILLPTDNSNRRPQKKPKHRYILKPHLVKRVA